MMAVAALLVAALSFLYWFYGPGGYPPCDGGIVNSCNGQWISNSEVNLYCGVGITLLIGILMLIISRKYNIVRNNTKLPPSLFGCMMLATPTLLIYLYPGSILCLVVLLAMWFMMDSFAQPESQRNVFAVFLMLSAGTAIDYGFALFLPVFWLALAQMRIMNLRSVLASLMGIATPWIILLGLGIVHVSELRLPQFWGENNLFTHSSFTAMLATGAFTAFLGIASWFQGFIKIISYNTQARAQLSMVTVVMLMSLIGACIDFTHISVFLPLLSCTASFFVGHLFGVIYTQERSWLAIFGIMLIYLGIYAWRLIVCFL